jgi:hypothetical protein
MLTRFLPMIAALLPALAAAQACPEKTLYYWQAFPAGGDSERMGLGAK